MMMPSSLSNCASRDIAHHLLAHDSACVHNKPSRDHFSIFVSILIEDKKIFVFCPQLDPSRSEFLCTSYRLMSRPAKVPPSTRRLCAACGAEYIDWDKILRLAMSSPDTCHLPDKNGFTALHHLARNDSVDPRCIQKLLEFLPALRVGD